MVWTTGAEEEMILVFSGGEPTFFDVYGRKLAAKPVGAGRYAVEVSGAPVFFVGARMDAGKTSLWREPPDACVRGAPLGHAAAICYTT